MGKRLKITAPQIKLFRNLMKILKLKYIYLA